MTNSVILLIKDNQATPYGSLTSLARETGWSYHTLSKKGQVKGFPFEHEGYLVDRQKVK